jgi:DNA-binding MarR family transcriptional regulator
MPRVPVRMLEDLRVRGVDIRVWGILEFLSDQRLSVRATDEEIGAEIGMTVRSIRISLNRLERFGYIARVSGPSGTRRIILNPRGNDDRDDDDEGDDDVIENGGN